MSSRRQFLALGAGVGSALCGLTRGAVAATNAGSSEFSLSERTTELLELFGLRYPIFQAPVGFSSGPDLVIAVSKAGGLGSMALTRATPQEAKERVARVRSQVPGAFVINFILGFELPALPAAVEAGAPWIQFSWGIPSPEMVAIIRSNGARFGVQVGSARGARRAFDAGASYVVLQGIEAGGHVQGTLPLMDALPGALLVAKGRPLFAAGGIASGSGIRKVLEAGASGAMLGTRFVATQESYAHPLYKAALVQAEPEEAVYTICFSGGWPNAPHRTLRNSTFENWEAAGCPPVGQRPGENDVLGRRADGSPILRYASGSPSRAITGDGIAEFALHAGLGVGRIRDIPTVEVLMARLWAECSGVKA